MSASVILEMERAALDRSDKGDANGFLEISDPEVVYIDPTIDKPIRGVEALREYYKGFSGGEPFSGEMLNPSVQLAGDAAVLAFNYVSRGLQTGREVRWNATEVYRRTPDGWRIIHTHWSFLKPQLAAQ
jgi:ketosteroid isomerase-like protein